MESTMTFEECCERIQRMRNDYKIRLINDIKRLEDQYLEQFSHIHQGDPIVLNGEFVGYFDEFYIDNGTIYVLVKVRPDSTQYVHLTPAELDGIRVAEPNEIV